ncbi:MAG: hypothetical protein WAZ18_04635 [Alphaproteobacteria bacterium]
MTTYHISPSPAANPIIVSHPADEIARRAVGTILTDINLAGPLTQVLTVDKDGQNVRIENAKNFSTGGQR